MPLSSPTEKVVDKPARATIKTITDLSSAPSRASRSPSAPRTKSGSHHLEENKTVRRTIEGKRQLARSHSSKPKVDLERLLPKLGSIFEEHRVGHTLQGHKPSLKLKEKGTSVTRRPKQSQSRGTKYVRPVESPLRRRPRTLLTSPSLASIISTLTTLTTSSSGSNSTVTPESSTMSTSSHRPSEPTEPVQSVDVKHEVSVTEPTRESIDVFQFMESEEPEEPEVAEDQYGWHSSSSAGDSDDYTSEMEAPIESRSLATLPERQHVDQPPTFWREQETVYSDSGISMGDSSPELRRVRFRYHQDDEEPQLHGQAKDSPPTSAHYTRKSSGRVQKLRFCDQQLPERQTLPMPLRILPPAQLPPQPTPVVGPLYLPRIDTASIPGPVGYGLLASKLSTPPPTTAGQEASPVALYRRFEPLNHRVLLHLQDELGELEGQLHFMDDLIARQSHEYSATAPRADSRQGSALHEQRTEVLGRVFLKLNQYSEYCHHSKSSSPALTCSSDQFLTSYKASCDLEAATKEDTENYRTWMRQNPSIVGSETRFLDRDSDLIRVPKRAESQQKVAALHSFALFQLSRYAELIPPAVFLLTLIFFALVEGIFARLLLLCVVAGGGSVAFWWRETDGGKILWRRGLGSCVLYFGALLVSAMAFG